MNLFDQVMEHSRFCCAKPPVALRGQGVIPASIERVLYCPWLFWWIFFIGLFFSLFVENCYCSMAKVLFLLALFIIASVCDCYRICLLEKDENYQIRTTNFSVNLMSSNQNIRFSNLNSRSSQMWKQQQLKIWVNSKLRTSGLAFAKDVYNSNNQ